MRLFEKLCKENLKFWIYYIIENDKDNRLYYITFINRTTNVRIFRTVGHKFLSNKDNCMSVIEYANNCNEMKPYGM